MDGKFLMIRLILFSLILLIPIEQGTAQELEVQLSIEWKNTAIDFAIPPLKPDTQVPVPFLSIEYCNHTDEAIYFEKIVETDGKYPSVGVSGFINTQMDLTDRAKVHQDFAGENYTVFISEIGRLAAAWIVLSDSKLNLSEYMLDIVNDELYEIYEVLKMQKLLDKYQTGKRLSIFEYPDKKVISYWSARSLIFEKRNDKPETGFLDQADITEESIAGRYKNDFIFLRAGERMKQEINLVGFYIVGGNFKFVIEDTSLVDYLLTIKNQKIILPDQVNGYQLYKGSFNVNSAEIKIRH